MKVLPRPTKRMHGTIDDVAPGGDGVAHIEINGERRAVFVPLAARGDEADLDVDLSVRPARGTIVHLTKSSPDRVTPPCVYVVRCGGCDWMHLSAEAQKAAHIDHVRRALPPEWRALEIAYHAATKTLGDRSRARIHVRSSGGRAIIGMHERGGYDPVEVDVCAIVDPTVDAARKLLGDVMEGAHGRGDVQIALGKNRKPVFDLHWPGPLPGEVYARLESATVRGDLAGARVLCGETTRPAIIGDPTPWTVGGDGEPLRLAPGGFAQTSESTNQALARRVAELVPDLSGTTGSNAAVRAVELFAGAGNLTVLLARKIAPIIAVESDADACEAARQNLLARGLTTSAAKVTHADATSYVLPQGVDVVVLDPPRTGAFTAVSRFAIKPPKTVVYISCDPPTLGRDLTVLAAAGMICTSIDLFEMFPQTSHVETVVALSRGPRAKPDK